MRRFYVGLVYAWMLFKSGVSMLQMDKQYDALNTPQIGKAQFEWAMAEEYRNKAKEEYASSQFQDAELLAAESIVWMNKAVEKSASRRDPIVMERAMRSLIVDESCRLCKVWSSSSTAF